MNQYGKRIRAARMKRGMTQVQLAALIDVDPSHICKIEKGKGTCSILRLQKISTVLGIPISDLLEDPPAKAVGE